MINRRFLRPNAANSMQNKKFQRQNAANSMRHGRFSSKMLQITRKMKGSSSKMLQIACSMKGKWQDRCRGRKNKTDQEKNSPWQRKKNPGLDSAPRSCCTACWEFIWGNSHAVTSWAQGEASTKSSAEAAERAVDSTTWVDPVTPCGWASGRAEGYRVYCKCATTSCCGRGCFKAPQLTRTKATTACGHKGQSIRA